MGLINLRTNLKDLKFGQDEYKGGSSGQPFIQTRIPATDEPLQTGISNAGPVLASVGAGAVIGIIGGSAAGAVGAGAAIGAALGLGIGIAGSNATGNSLRLPSAGTGGPDFLLRGGTLLPGILANDAIRLTKYFASTEGVLFTTKQNLLSRLAVKTQASPRLLNDGVYTPLSSLSQAIGNPFGLHLNKQGLNPFLGIGDSYTPDRYFDVVTRGITNPTNNRLIDLYGAKILVPKDGNPDPIFINNNGVSTDPNILLSYEGGPNSFLGIGKTNIRSTSDFLKNYNPLSNNSTNNPLTNYVTLSYRGLNTYTYDYTTSADNSKAIQQFRDGLFSNSPRENIIINLSDVEIASPKQIYELNNPRNINSYVPTIYQKDFREALITLFKTSTILSKSPSYDPAINLTIEQRVKLGDPGNKTEKNLLSYTQGIGTDPLSPLYGAASNNSIDRINALEIYNSESPNSELGNDLVKFRIGVIDNNSPSKKTYIHFRAFLDQISDNYSSNWDPTKYIGRGENFYTYSGFDRKVSLGWTVAAQSKAELIPMYRKLNYLASICTPDYSPNGYMRGNIITLTIGGYFYEQPGIITSLNYEMNSDNETWEIGINDKGESDPSVKELPHLIRVTGFNFIPIHQFVPRKQQNKFDEVGILTEYGNEHYIALSAEPGESNYKVQSI
jgi:hypothetical protein